MDMDRDKILDKAARLLAMAERGEPGERDNARRLLGEMLDKHGLTMDELDDNQPKWWLCDIKTRDEGDMLYLAMRAAFPDEVISSEIHAGDKPFLCLYGMRGGQLASASVLADRVLDAYRASKAEMQERHRAERSAERRAKQEADKRRKCERKILMGSFLIRNDLVPLDIAKGNGKYKRPRKLSRTEHAACVGVMHDVKAVDRTDRLTAGHNQLPQ